MKRLVDRFDGLYPWFNMMGNRSARLLKGLKYRITYANVLSTLRMYNRDELMMGFEFFVMSLINKLRIIKASFIELSMGITMGWRAGQFLSFPLTYLLSAVLK